MNEDLSRKQTLMLQGMAISMMLFHHLFLNEDFSRAICTLVFSPEGHHLEQRLAWFCKLCVGLYAWVSGYGLQKALGKVSDSDASPVKLWKETWIQVMKRFLNFYRHFLFVGIISLGIMFRISLWNFDPMHYLTDVLGFTTNYNGSWWYVAQYFKMLLMLPFIHIFFTPLNPRERSRKRTRLFSIVLLCMICGLVFVRLCMPLLWKYVFSAIVSFHPEFIYCFLTGYLTARFELFSKADTYIFKLGEPLKTLIPMAVLALVFSTRVFLATGAAYADHDFIFAPLFAYGVTRSILRLKPLEILFSSLGKHSFTMWLIHIFLMDISTVGIISRLGFYLSPGVYLALLCITYALALVFDYGELLLLKVLGRLTGKKYNKK